MIRVVHLITGLEIGGAERVLANLVRRSDAARFEHRVVSMTDLGPVGVELCDAGFRVGALGMRRGRPSLSGFWKLVRLLRREKPHCLQCWMYHANLLGLMAARLAGVKQVIWGIHDAAQTLDRFSPLTRLVVRVGGWLSRFSTVIIVCSRSGLESHQTLGYDAAKMVVIPNGYDLDVFKPDPEARLQVRRELGLRDDALLIGLMARVDPVKDHATFFRAAGILKRKRPQVYFVLAGSGISPDNGEILSMVQENALEGFVRLLGPRSDIRRLTAALDIASLSSSSEAFPNVVGEAMACGVPCVVTDAGDARYLVGDTGITVSPRDPEAMAAGWRSLIEMGTEARRALGQKARERIEAKFHLATIVSAYESQYVLASGAKHEEQGALAT